MAWKFRLAHLTHRDARNIDMISLMYRLKAVTRLAKTFLALFMALFVLLFQVSATPLTVYAQEVNEQQAQDNVPRGENGQLTRDQAMLFPFFGQNGCADTPSSSVQKATGNKIYMLGDSITAGAKDKYKEALKDKDLEISARVGRSWKTPGQEAAANEGSQGTGEEAFKADAEKIKSADAIIIALGTNQMGGGPDSSNPIDSILDGFGAVNPTAPIWWVNIANTGVAGVPGFNAELQKRAAENKIAIIDWAKAVDPDGDGTHNPGGLLSSDGTHPSEEGNKKLVEIVSAAVLQGAGTTNNAARPGDCKCSSNAGSISGDPIVRFLQALAFQENGGNTTGLSAGGAKGKFQYIDQTWRGMGQRYYPPALKYATANDAPVEVQDALTYIEYTDKFKMFDGDLFKLGISHFYPVANDDPSKLDIIPPSNVITPRQYAEKLIAGFNSNAGKEIEFKHQEAPEFAEHLAKVSGGNVTVQSGEGSCSSPDQIGPNEKAGVIVETALKLAWDTKKDGLVNKEDAKPEYQEAMPKYNGSTHIAPDPKKTPWSDCGVFVATVLHMSGADTDYPKRGTWDQEPHLRNSGKYEVIENVTDSSQLKPGDIIINAEHTMIFVGTQQGPEGEYNTVDASYGDRVPGAKIFAPYPTSDKYPQGLAYAAFRLKG